jgi:integrase
VSSRRAASRVKDLWFSEVKGVRKKTSKHPDNGGSKDAKRWLAVWIGPDGREKTKAFAKKVDADRYGTTQEADVARGAYVDPRTARMTVEQWCETWLTGYATRRPSTIRSAEVHIAKITEHLGSVPLSMLRPSHVRSWTSGLREEGLADSYVYALHRRLSQIMSDAVHDEIIPKSPCSRRTSPGQGKPRPYVATTDQVWALYDVMPERYRAAILLGAFVGLRMGEACGLRVVDIDFLRGVVHPQVQYPAEPLKTETSRTAVPIPLSLAVELSAHIQAGYSGETLLTDDAGAQLRPWSVVVLAVRPRVPAGGGGVALGLPDRVGRTRVGAPGDGAGTVDRRVGGGDADQADQADQGREGGEHDGELCRPRRAGALQGVHEASLRGDCGGGRTLVRITVNSGQIKGEIAKATVNSSRHRAVAPVLSMPSATRAGLG